MTIGFPWECIPGCRPAPRRSAGVQKWGMCLLLAFGALTGYVQEQFCLGAGLFDSIQLCSSVYLTPLHKHFPAQASDSLTISFLPTREAAL